MFYTPGWGVILGVGGTVTGVVITQVANTAFSWRTSRKARHDRIIDAVTELVAAGNSWVYATSTQEQDLLRDVATRVPEEKLMENLAAARAVLYSAQLDFGRALARVRLTCPKKVVNSAEVYRTAVMNFEQESRDKGSVALQTRSVHGIQASEPSGTVSPLARLVEATKKAT
jgi:hypothetical protein